MKLLEVREPRQILLEDGDIPEIRTNNTWFIHPQGDPDETWSQIWVNMEAIMSHPNLTEARLERGVRKMGHCCTTMSNHERLLGLVKSSNFINSLAKIASENHVTSNSLDKS